MKKNALLKRVLRFNQYSVLHVNVDINQVMPCRRHTHTYIFTATIDTTNTIPLEDPVMLRFFMAVEPVF